jgi:WhiB family transcriptional regulator, redox-sensing transcriptional regulator
MTGRGLWPFVLARAACSNSRLNPGDWYPVSVPVAAARRQAAAAIAVCAGCPVRDECLELALRNWAIGQFGVWGGTVPAGREKPRAGRVTQLAHVLPGNQPAEQVAS